MVWTVIAAIASLVAAACALAAVRQAAQLRREARQQILADALIAMISATGTAPSADPAVTDAIRQIERAAGLSLLGLGAQVKESILGLLDPKNHDNPPRLLMYATKAYEELMVENGGLPIFSNPDAHTDPDTHSLVTQVLKRLLLRASERLRGALPRP